MTCYIHLQNEAKTSFSLSKLTLDKLAVEQITYFRAPQPGATSGLDPS
jgi:hypothetical protein